MNDSHGRVWSSVLLACVTLGCAQTQSVDRGEVTPVTDPEIIARLDRSQQRFERELQAATDQRWAELDAAIEPALERIRAKAMRNPGYVALEGEWRAIAAATPGDARALRRRDQALQDLFIRNEPLLESLRDSVAADVNEIDMTLAEFMHRPPPGDLITVADSWDVIRVILPPECTFSPPYDDQNVLTAEFGSVPSAPPAADRETGEVETHARHSDTTRQWAVVIDDFTLPDDAVWVRVRARVPGTASYFVWATAGWAQAWSKWYIALFPGDYTIPILTATIPCYSAHAWTVFGGEFKAFECPLTETSPPCTIEATFRVPPGTRDYRVAVGNWSTAKAEGAAEARANAEHTVECIEIDVVDGP